MGEWPEPFAASFKTLVANVERYMHGKREAVELAVVCLLAEGHLLLEDLPGVGKTSLAKCLAASLDLTMKRVQFTPDLLPTDVTGTPVYQPKTGELVFRPGPVFANVVLADEVNRATPRAQSALLEAMEERQVTVDGVRHPLPRPFVVLATQNPVDAAGTYPLPEAQLDRFLMRIRIGYPGFDAEKEILRDKLVDADGHTAAEVADVVGPVLSADDVRRLVGDARRVVVDDAVHDYVLTIVRTTRTLLADADATPGQAPAPRRRGPLAVDQRALEPIAGSLVVGASPRASVGLLRAAQVRAAASGREHVRPEEVKALAVPVLAHRLLLSSAAALAGQRAEDIIRTVLTAVQVPR